MNNKNTFQIIFNERNIDVPKENIEFQNGYAVIKTTIKTTAKSGWAGYWYDYDLDLMGVIDENFDTVLEFKGWYSDIQVFPEGNLIVQVRFSGGDGEQSYTIYKNQHYKINGCLSTKVDELDILGYDKINETTIKAKNRGFGSGFEALYDVVKGKYISEKFSVIENFEQQNEGNSEKFAKAIMRLASDDGTKNVCDIICFIDELGMIRTSLYNTYSDSIIETNTEGFDFLQTIETIKRQMLEYSPIKEEFANSVQKN